MLRSCGAAASTSDGGNSNPTDDDAGNDDEHEGADSVEDLEAQGDNSVCDLEDPGHSAKDVLEQHDGVDHPDDVGAHTVHVTGAGNEALLQEATGNSGRKPQGLRSPTAPTPEEYATHVLTHIPYRNWCWHCVASRRPNEAHRLRNNGSNTDKSH